MLYLIFVHEKPTGDTFWHVGNNTIKFDPDTLEIIPNTDETGRKDRYNVFKEFKLIRNASDQSTLYMFFSLFFWTMSTDVFGTFLSLWGPEYALLSDSILGSMSIITAVVLLALGYPAAIITKKKGRLWTMRLGSLCLIIAYGALIIFQELGRANFGSVALVGVIACIVLKTFGGSLIAISAITITWQLAPDYKVGTYTGLYYLFKQLGQVLSPILFGGIISIFTALLGETMAWIVFIPYCLIFSILFYWTFAKVKKGEVGDTWNPTPDVASKDDLETE